MDVDVKEDSEEQTSYTGSSYSALTNMMNMISAVTHRAVAKPEGSTLTRQPKASSQAKRRPSDEESDDGHDSKR
eukprot:m.341613 g.341613  ORF g.341613 m.341613 type:complete len:74 (+) comp20258_c0_seq1:221-442(+)